MLYVNKDTAFHSVVSDAFRSLLNALEDISISEEAQADFKYLLERAEEASTSILGAALHEGIELTPALGALFVMGGMSNWDNGGHSFICQFDDVLHFAWPLAASAAGSPDSRILYWCIESAKALAELEQAEQFAPEATKNAINAFLGLALTLDDAKHQNPALAAAQTAANLAGALEPKQAEFAGQLALLLARQSSDPDHAAAETARHACVLAKVAQQSPDRRLDSFQAFEAALHRLPSDTTLRSTVVQMIEPWLDSEDYLSPLRPILWAALPPEEQGLLPPEVSEALAYVSRILNPVLQESLREWIDFANPARTQISSLDYIRAWTTAIENWRLRLDPTPTRTQGEARWSDWTIQHPSLLRSVPHNRSFLRERDLDELLLVLNHEITHIYSMMGAIGIASLAMRCSVFRIELGLCGLARSDDKRESARELLETHTPAPLIKPDPIALAQAERALEIERKVQMLEECWKPWFEGLALFGELAANPEQDSEATSPTIGVLINLWDTHMPSMAKAYGISIAEAYERVLAEAEALYARAIHTSGKYRLRTHLVDYGEQYLAGYLAVRGIVASWRSSLQTPLSGAEAFRILLHMTRFGSQKCIPDLSLPLEIFREELMTRQIRWLHTVAATSRADLQRCLDSVELVPDQGLLWYDGHLKQASITELEEEGGQYLVELEQQCLLTLCGERAAPGRVSDASEGCHDVMRSIADLLGELYETPTRPMMFTNTIVDYLTASRTILPIGSAICPFWLLTETRTLACLIRTQEKHRDTKEPSYNMYTYRLEDSEFDALQELVMQIGHDRMTVTRVADLAPPSEGRGRGMSCLVFQYEGWMHIQPHGMLFGSVDIEPSLRNAIELRLSNNPVVAALERLTAADHPCAVRTKQWVESNDWDLQIAGIDVDLRPWAQRVSELASDLIPSQSDPVSNIDSDISMAARQLFHFVFGDPEIAEALASHGLSALNRLNFDSLDKLFQVLVDSGLRPIEDNQKIRDLSQSITGYGVPILALGQYGWDVVAIDDYLKEVLPNDERNHDDHS